MTPFDAAIFVAFTLAWLFGMGFVLWIGAFIVSGIWEVFLDPFFGKVFNFLGKLFNDLGKLRWDIVSGAILLTLFLTLAAYWWQCETCF